MEVGSDIYIRGRLIEKSEIIVLRDDETGGKDPKSAVEFLNDNGYYATSNPTKVILIEEHKRMWKYISRFTNKILALGIGLAKQLRTHRQNRFYWGLIVQPIIDFEYERTGIHLTKIEVHLHNLQVIYGWQPEIEQLFDGNMIIRVDKIPRTSKMSKQEFTDFIQLIEDYHSKRGLDFTKYIDEGDGTLNWFIEKLYSNES